MKKLTLIGIALSLLLGLVLWSQQQTTAAKAASMSAPIVYATRTFVFTGAISTSNISGVSPGDSFVATLSYDDAQVPTNSGSGFAIYGSFTYSLTVSGQTFTKQGNQFLQVNNGPDQFFAGGTTFPRLSFSLQNSAGTAFDSTALPASLSLGDFDQDKRVIWETTSTEAFVGEITSITGTTGFNFTGFFQPMDNPPIVNVATAGQAIPVKFSLGGYQGMDIFAAGYPLSGTIQCSSATPTDAIEETVTAGGSSLSYDATTDQYTYVWKTGRAWKGQCRKLVVMFNDGSLPHESLFKFK